MRESNERKMYVLITNNGAIYGLSSAIQKQTNKKELKPSPHGYKPTNQQQRN